MCCHRQPLTPPRPQSRPGVHCDRQRHPAEHPRPPKCPQLHLGTRRPTTNSRPSSRPPGGHHRAATPNPGTSSSCRTPRSARPSARNSGGSRSPGEDSSSAPVMIVVAVERVPRSGALRRGRRRCGTEHVPGRSEPRARVLLGRGLLPRRRTKERRALHRTAGWTPQDPSGHLGGSDRHRVGQPRLPPVVPSPRWSTTTATRRRRTRGSRQPSMRRPMPRPMTEPAASPDSGGAAPSPNPPSSPRQNESAGALPLVDPALRPISQIAETPPVAEVDEPGSRHALPLQVGDRLRDGDVSAHRGEVAIQQGILPVVAQ